MARSRISPWKITLVILGFLIVEGFLIAMFVPEIFDPTYRIPRQVIGLQLEQVEAKYGPAEFSDETIGDYGHWDKYYKVAPGDGMGYRGYYLAIRLDENSTVTEARIVPIGT
jgi:hypothetical protein